jgi:DNA-directed RNA polymerase specialized sigma24 family protein
MNVTKNQNTNDETHHNLILKTLKAIPKLQREVFVLKTIHNYSTKAICNVLKIDDTQFWTYMHDARQQLAGTLQ